ncbi:crotonase/enoyl-CoA hydratase family protein [Frateuria aurantia]
MTDRIRYEVIEGIARIGLARPEQRNGMDLAMLGQMRRIQATLRRHRRVRAVVLYGEGLSFCAGLDFKSVMGRRADLFRLAASLWLPWRNALQDWSLGWRQLPFPVVAAIQGHCFGAGLQLALGADIRVAAADAELSFMEARWGLIPDMGGLALVRELMAPDHALDLVLSGRIVGGEEALRLGLVTAVAAEPMQQALTWAEALSVGSPDAVAAGKRALLAGWHEPTAGMLARERRWQRRLLGSPNQRLAMRRGRQLADDFPPYRPRQMG